jgi:hypothetical protein
VKEECGTLPKEKLVEIDLIIALELLIENFGKLIKLLKR